MSPSKISVNKEKKSLHIIWDDNFESLVQLKKLRENCPCAACLDEKKHQPKNYIPLYSGIQLTLTDIKPVGTYAIQLFWKDGHSTGIFRYELLKKLEDKPPPQ